MNEHMTSPEETHRQKLAVLRTALIAQIIYEVGDTFLNLSTQGARLPWAELDNAARTKLTAEAQQLLDRWPATPEELHTEYVTMMLKDGWTNGEVYDPKLRTIPGLESYALKPLEYRQLDALKLAVIRGFVE